MNALVSFDLHLVWPHWLRIQSASVLPLFGCSSENSTEPQCLSFWCHAVKVLVINKCLKIDLCHCHVCACLHTVFVMQITQYQCNHKCSPGHCVGEGLVKMIWSGFISLSDEHSDENTELKDYFGEVTDSWVYLCVSRDPETPNWGYLLRAFAADHVQTIARSLCLWKCSGSWGSFPWFSTSL